MSTPKNILVIDDSRTFRKYASLALTLEWPDVHVIEHNPSAQDNPATDFTWPDYDVVLLDYQLGLEEQTGLDWLGLICQQVERPVVIFMTAAGNEEIAVAAMKLGADDYVSKTNQSFRRVIDTIHEAMEFKTRTEQAAKQSGTVEQSIHRRLLNQDEMARIRHAGQDDTAGSYNDTVTLTMEQLAPVRGKRIPKPRPELSRTDSGVALPPGYRFVSELGQKNLSTVVLAEHEANGRPVVLKIINTIEVGDDPASFKRFIQEYTLIAHVRHPHIVRIHEQNFSFEHAFIAMEYFPRGSLGDRIRQGQSKTEIITCFREIAYGLRAVHDMGIVHRDLKPSNILFRQDGSLAITDFGIAKLLRGRQSLTLDGMVIGTPNYMSPEQATGDEADTRSDLYSLGLILYEMLTGELPFKADDVIGLLYAHVHIKPAPLPEGMAAFQPIIDGLLAKKPADRFTDVDALLETLGDTAI